MIDDRWSTTSSPSCLSPQRTPKLLRVVARQHAVELPLSSPKPALPNKCVSKSNLKNNSSSNNNHVLEDFMHQLMLDVRDHYQSHDLSMITMTTTATSVVADDDDQDDVILISDNPRRPPSPSSSCCWKQQHNYHHHVDERWIEGVVGSSVVSATSSSSSSSPPLSSSKKKTTAVVHFDRCLRPIKRKLSMDCASPTNSNDDYSESSSNGGGRLLTAINL